MANATDLLNEYIVFEPDQVLTNDHLNELFNYLDNQNRLTRNKFIGIGIACGLQISSDGKMMISISNGCGITSEGYSIVLKNNPAPAIYTSYIPYGGIATPTHLPFLNDPAKLPFYQPYCAAQANVIYQLLTADEAAISKDNPVQLFSAGGIDLNLYNVVLFLEAAETDLRNCSMQDCNNNGEKIDFTIRPLLVQKEPLQTPIAPAPDIYLPRYKIPRPDQQPYTDLNNTDDVLNGFMDIIKKSNSDTNTAIISQIQTAYNWCHNTYFLKEDPFDFSLLQNLESSILTNNPTHIQYLYDYLNDLKKAYYEFKEKAACLTNSDCCPDETKFPLHLVLGEAVPNVNIYAKSLYRQYFIYSPLMAKQCNGAGEVKFLFDRMRMMLSEFNFPSIANGIKPTRLSEVIIKRLPAIIPTIITPSEYELAPLSDRAIPYYYLNANNGFDIYPNWNYRKTIEGKANYNLSYNANKYPAPAPPDFVINPLLYDIERFNFFRIEGHIGENYQTVLTDIQGQISKFNLPFDVVAVSADMLSANAVLPQCNMLDLETNYKLIVNEFASKIHTIYNFILNIPVQTNDPIFMAWFKGFDSFRTQALAKLSQLLIFNPGGNFARGGFIKKYFSPPEGSFGAQYISTSNPILNIDAIFHNLNFTNLQVAQATKATADKKKSSNIKTAATDISTNTFIFNKAILDITSPYTIGSFIGSVDSMMGYLTTNDISLIDINNLNTSYYTPFINSIASFKDTLIGWMANAITNAQGQADSLAEDNMLDEFINELDTLLSSNLDEKLGVIKSEYTNRLNNYQSQLNFLNYFQQNSGIEHRAGVPQSGTFVLVYYQEPASGTNLPPAITVDKETINTNLDRVKEFLVKNIDSINSITNKDLANLFASAQATSTASQYNLQDGAIIADFCVPYLCCSDCAPIAYVLPPAQPIQPPIQPTITPTITIATSNLPKGSTQYCNNDTASYVVTISPAGGNISPGDGIDQTKLLFTPSKLPIGTYKFTYTVGTIQSPVPAVVEIVSAPSGNISINGTITLDTTIKEIRTLNLSFKSTLEAPSYIYEWSIITPTSIKITQPGENKMDFTPQIALPKNSVGLTIVVSLKISNPCGELSGIKQAFMLIIAKDGSLQLNPISSNNKGLATKKRSPNISKIAKGEVKKQPKK